MPKNENAVAMFDPAQVPAHIAAFNEAQSNIKARANGNTLTYKGKVFTVAVNGTKTVLMKRDENGDEEPRTVIPLIILDFAPRRGRAFYEGGFDDSKPKAPTCWSADGRVPDEAVAEKQSAKCATCPMSVKGSKVSDEGKETKACAEHLYVAVQLFRKLEVPPLRLRLAITSIYDARNKEQEDKGWYAFDQYRDMLRARGVNHSASLVTKVKFDPAAAYPKLLFSNSQWLNEEELEEVAAIKDSAEVADLINPVFEGDPSGSTPTEDAEVAGPKGGKPAAAKPAAAKLATTKPAVGKPATTKPASKPAPAPVEPEEDGTEEDGTEGEVVTEGGEDATDATDVTELVEGAEEEDDEEKAVREAEEKAAALRAKIAARKKAETEAAAKAAKVRKAAPAEDDDGDGTVVVAPPKAPKAVTTATPAKPVATAGKVSTGKPVAPKGTPAAKPAAMSAEVSDIIEDW
jgi:hypothetical protein